MCFECIYETSVLIVTWVVAVAADTVSGRAKPPGDSSRGKRFPIQYVLFFKVCLKSFAVHLVRQPADVEGILNLRKLDINRFP